MSDSFAPQSTVTLAGIAGSPGVAIGHVFFMGGTRVFTHRTIRGSDVPKEIERFREAVETAQAELRAVSARVGSEVDDSILEAYVHMVGDVALADSVNKDIEEKRHCAEWAVADAIKVVSQRLAAVDDAYLRERSHDVEFVGERLLRALSGSPDSGLPKLEGPSVVVARDLSPADTAAMIREPVVAFITEMGTRTSHTAIMARALEIPAVVGIGAFLERVAPGDLIIVDGLRGQVIIRPTEVELEGARTRGARHVALTETLHAVRDKAAITMDGVRLSVRANVELPEEAKLAREHGAEGIGLYRTEFLYVDRERPPTEDEQYEIFRRVIEATNPRPVTLRTFDIGGDKFVSTFQVPPEMNPMLGLRAVRLAFQRPDVFLEHLRAMVRASAHGDVRIMLPMVVGLNELRQGRKFLEQAKEQVRARGLAAAEDIPLGVMIEVPSAAVLVDHFAREASFMSIGTNDLIQYALAVDRTSQSLAYLSSPFDPSIIRLIDGVVRAGREHNCPVSLCGAMASDPLAAVMLLGLGVRDFSMESAAIPEIKETFRRVTRSEAESIAHEAMELATAEDVEHSFAEAFAPRLYDILTGEVPTN